MVHTYLRECIEAIGSQTFRLGLNFSPVCKHIVPSLPPRNKHRYSFHEKYKLSRFHQRYIPIQYRKLSTAATPDEDRRLDIDGTDIHFPIRGSSLSTLD